MKKNANLRFLLALGNTKIVLVEDDQEIKLYSKHEDATKHAVSEDRVLDAVTSIR